MEDNPLVEPDLVFIREIINGGGADLKKCFQCATCTVACQLSTDRQPFPRKEMLFASWGLKDRLLGNPDIWLCHSCGDCSTRCPRNAKPGDILGVMRRLTIQKYAKPVALNRIINDPRMLPLMIVLPALVILAVGWSSGLLHLRHSGGPIVYAHFFPVLLIEIIFIPLTILAAGLFFSGIRTMLADMKFSYIRRGMADGSPFRAKTFLAAMVKTLRTVIGHDNFSNCDQISDRKLYHMMVAFSFIGLALVAGAFVFALYVLDSHGPYPQLNPVKLFANLSGLALILGALFLIKERLAHPTGVSTYYDWHLLGLALLLGITGMLTQLIRLAGWPAAAMTVYLLHLVMAFNLIAFLPYTKLAHAIYRSVAMAYAAYVSAKAP